MNDNFDKNQDKKIDKESLNQEDLKREDKEQNLDETFEEEKNKNEDKENKEENKLTEEKEIDDDEDDDFDVYKEELKKRRDELKESLKKNFNRDYKNKKMKRVSIKINFKALLMLIFIISLIFYIPTMMSDSKANETREVSYSEFVNNLNNGNIKYVNEQSGYIYAYEKSSVVDTDKALTNLFNKKEGRKDKVTFKARMITDRLGDDKELLSLLAEKSIDVKSLDPEEYPSY